MVIYELVRVCWTDKFCGDNFKAKTSPVWYELVRHSDLVWTADLALSLFWFFF